MPPIGAVVRSGSGSTNTPVNQPTVYCSAATFGIVNG
jgi:hypothetical protein